ncbi:hypothetical protein [Paraglaciecola sp. 2405UD69-4]|uniref:hypothetical protein n=1 Tax=Paraglaciecola sp. 2405UD69-4 TaxID=3391836 RepID=UPI0039C9AF81
MKINKLIAVFTLLIGFQANANMIEIQVDKNAVNVGEVVNVTLLANIEDAIDEFDFDFTFDNSVFGFVSDSEQTDLTEGYLSVFAASENLVGLGLGYINFETAVQGTYSITFQLVGLLTGSSEFGLDVNTFQDFFGGASYTVDPVTSTTVNVSAPATLSLFGVVALALFGFRRKA